MKHNPSVSACAKKRGPRSRCSSASSPPQPGSTADRIATSWRCRDPQPVREFRTFTGELERLADWLAQCRIKTVAMESTGVYWIPLCEILERAASR